MIEERVTSVTTYQVGKNLTDAEIQNALDEITGLHKEDSNFISVEYTENDVIVVRYANRELRPRTLPDVFRIESGTQGVVTVRIDRTPNRTTDSAILPSGS